MGKKAIVNEILCDSGVPANFHRLNEIYKDDPYKARVIFLSRTFFIGKQIRVHKFIYDNGDIEFATYTKRWGVSISNKMYSYSKKECSLYYKKETNRFFARSDKKILYEPNYTSIIELVSSQNYNLLDENLTVLHEIAKEFPYLRFLFENINSFSGIRVISLNTIIRNKLFSYKKLVRFCTKLPYPVFDYLIKLNQKNGMFYSDTINGFFFKEFKGKYRKFTKNIENIQDDWVNEEKIKSEINLDVSTFWSLVIDTIKASRTLNKKFNFSWSIKRVKQEHDNLFKEIIHISSEIDNRPIKVGDVFLKFEEYSGFKLIKHTSELRFEGIKNNNCVYTRLNNIESGNSAIFSIDGHTCQIHNWNGLYIQEISKYSNTLADSSVVASINEKIKSFNIEVLKIDPTKLVSPGVYTQEGDHAIFDAPPDFQRFEYNDLPF